MNDVLVLNWNELEVSKDSVRRLLKEPNLNVIVVDNGSIDGSKEYFSSIKNDHFIFVSLKDNRGSSFGRNKGLEVSKGKNIFLLDGDILYVKGTIAEYQKILSQHKDAFCVGQHSMELLNKTGHNGVYDPMDADLHMSYDYKIEDWFPMAWTQYGLFRGDLLRKTKFYQEGIYGEAGYGFEDDWLYHEMKLKGYRSLAVDKPAYYHFAHSGARQLLKSDTDAKMYERKDIFEKRWGKGMGSKDVAARK